MKAPGSSLAQAIFGVSGAAIAIAAPLLFIRFLLV